MKTTITEKDGKTIVAVKGELDTDTSKVFQKDVEPLTEKEGLTVEMEVSGLEYISSKAIRVLISFQQAIRSKGGSLKLTGVQPAVREVFDMTGLSKSFLAE